MRKIIAVAFIVTLLAMCRSEIKQGAREEDGTRRRDHPPTIIKKTNEEFLRLQLHAINAYKKTNPSKSWRCSYEDHVNSFKSIPNMTTADELMITELMNQGEGDILSGAEAISSDMRNDFELLLFWKGVYVNTLEYYNVLYGGTKIVHVGFGTKAPASFYKMNNDDYLYFDLLHCIPFADWIRSKKDGGIKKTLLIPTNTMVYTRNSVHGIAAIRRFSMMPRNMTIVQNRPLPHESMQVSQGVLKD